MENVENLFKHKIFFTQLDIEQLEHSTDGTTIKRRKTYESNTIYDHKKLCFTNKNELLTQIKPFLYYLGSIDMNREGDRYQCETVLTIELRLKYKNNMLWIVEIGTNVNFNIFLACGFF